MKLTTCQFDQLFLLLAAFFFLNSLLPRTATTFVGASKNKAADTTAIAAIAALSDALPALTNSTAATTTSTTIASTEGTAQSLLATATTYPPPPLPDAPQDDAYRSPAEPTPNSVTATLNTVNFIATASTDLQQLNRITALLHAEATTREPAAAPELVASGSASRKRHAGSFTQSIQSARQHEQQQQRKKSAAAAKHRAQSRQQRQEDGLLSSEEEDATTSPVERVAVLMPSQVLARMPVQQGFDSFIEFFQVKLRNVSVDFIQDDDFSGFIRLLGHPKYTTVVKTLNAGINIAGDGIAASQIAPPLPTARARRQQQPQAKKKKNRNGQLRAAEQRQRQSDETTKSSYCQLAAPLTREFNKSVLLWPCPKMKESSNFLPSFEAISYAVKSIASKLNWTQVDIFVGDNSWALPLAIAANLHIPHNIEIGAYEMRDLAAEDRVGKALIITADMNDDSTLSLLGKLEKLQHTKVLLIDIVATSFNAENRFYKNLARMQRRNANVALMPNLLLLTVLSDKYRHFLKVAFVDNGIDIVQNFRQLRLWRAMNTNRKQHASNWPMHLDSSVTRVLQQIGLWGSQSEETTTTTTESATRSAENESIVALLECGHVNVSTANFVEICQRVDTIAQTCASRRNGSKSENHSDQRKESLELRALLTSLCQLQPDSSEADEMAQQKIDNLRNFIDFFHFYDYLSSNLMPHPTPKVPMAATAIPETIEDATQMPKYDFIVLDIVLGEQSTAIDNSSQLFSNSDNETKTTAPPPASIAATLKWRPLFILEQHEFKLNTYITHSILPGYDDWLLVSTSQLWHCGAICWTIVAICFGMLLIIVAASVAAGIAIRNYLLRKRLSKGPNKIVLSANDFVFPVDSRRVDEGIEAMLCCWLQQLQEFGGPEVDKPDLLKGSIGSLKNLGLIIPGSTPGTTTTTPAAPGATNNGKHAATLGAVNLARHNPALLDMRARYNGDLVQLKEIALNGSNELKSKAMDMLVMSHGLRHENINPLIGWLSDPNRTALVFDYCSRGSLQDVLIMDEIKLDWSFRLSLLTDLVRGMRYLHASPLRVHGTLTSRNCVVDARWVLKITDYGLTSFYDAQGLAPPTRNAKELLWTAPELLRAMKSQPPHHQHHHHHGRGGASLGTPLADVYAFGIIMQEVVVRGEPYCMLSLSAEEIIAKIKKPPPLIRPSVSKGAAPPEAINIMRQCWAEQPEMRPDFNSVYERFKMLNHGRKVNFVDTMFQMLEKYSNNLEELIRERTDQLDIERKKTEQLLNRMLPSSVAEKLKMGLAVDPEEFSDVTIYFSDIVGFTTIAAHCSPVQVVDLLNDLYTIFDATINAYNVYKVETIGDAYMVVSGLPVKIADHAEQIATMALDLLHQSGRFNVKHLPGVPLQLRIGLHTGPCCAGVVGLTMPRYCLFGDTVNTASRMESTGSSWRIHMSQETRDRLEARGGYMIEPRGLIDIKGKGMMSTFWLLGKKGFDKPLPAPPPIGLDESLIRNSITLKAQANKSRNSTNPSSSQSSSLAGESVEVKVEITPPANTDLSNSNQPTSYSVDSNSTTTISPSTTLRPDFPSKTPSTSPQSRKMSDLPPETLLNPSTFNRLPNSAGGSSSRLYKKIEEMMDLSLPYNHYKCLSPSESNLTAAFADGKYLYSCSGGGSSGAASTHSSSTRFDSKPGSTRLLRRQFSLDREDTSGKGEHHHAVHHFHHQQHHQCSLPGTHTVSLAVAPNSNKSTTLDIPVLLELSRSPKGGTLARIHKQNSSSIAQDLEKIEEIPLSPASSQHHSSLDSNLNRSPPSTLETQSPPPQTSARGTLLAVSPPQLSAPASPSPSTRSFLGHDCVRHTMESKTTPATPGQSEARRNHNKPTELTLNVETLLSR